MLKSAQSGAKYTAYGWQLEGCHRLRAAHELGLTPVIVDVANEETITIQNDEADVTVNVLDEAIELTDNVTKTQLLDF